MKTLRSIPMMAVMVTMLFALPSCEKDDPDGPAPAGTFAVKMTDAPGDYEALDVQITKVEVYHEGSGWITLNNDLQVVSVLELTNGAETQLSYEGEAEAGVYSKVRLTFGDDHYLSFDSGTDLGFDIGGMPGGANATIALVWAGSSSREVVINIDEAVSADAGAAILLDFHVMESIVQNGQQFVIDPAITLITDASTGVQGQIEGAASAAVVVSDGQNSFSSSTNASGHFLIRGVPHGVYAVLLMPSQEGQGLLDQAEDQVIDGVLVTEGEITQMGTIQF